MSKLFLVFGVLFTVYYIGIILYAGIHASFAWIWAALGAVCWLALAVCRVSALQAAFLRVPAGLRMAAGILLALGFLLFLAAESCILSGMAQGGVKSCDYVIVLGAQVRGTRVSRALKQRLDRAAEYLEESPETVVIVSGGQGSGEDITEAQAMEEYLIGAGIAPERIWKEEESVNTVQNIRFSRALIEERAPADGETLTIGIVSNDFHVFRAVHIAKAQGIEAEGIPAPTEIFMRPHYMTREALALVKDLLLGNAVF